MIKRILVLMMAFMLALPCFSCGGTASFFIRSPYNEDQQFGAFDNLDDAKKALDGIKQLGYIIYNSKNKVEYCPFDSVAQSKILYQSKFVADFVRENGYKYGDAQVNPSYDQGRTEKKVSCDRYVAWAIFLAGYTKSNYENSRLNLYGEKNLENYLLDNGFVKINDVSDVRAGDVVFVGDSREHYPNLQGYWLDYPDHVFICAGKSQNDHFYRYDAGSNARLQSVQPFDEPLEYLPDKNFRYAYRAPEAF